MVEFNNALIINVRSGVSKAGNPWTSINFLDQNNLQVYDLMQFGDSAAVTSGLVRGSVYSLRFNIEPSRDGGVRLVLVSVEHI